MSAEGNDIIEGETSKERESNTSNPIEAYVLTIVLFVVVPSVLFVLSDRFTDQAWMDIAANVVAFSASNAVTMTIVLSMYYALGFRLRKRLA